MQASRSTIAPHYETESTVGQRLRQKHPTTVPIIVDISGLYNGATPDCKVLVQGDQNLVASIRRFLSRLDQQPDRSLSVLARGPTVLTPSLNAMEVWGLRRDPRDDVLYLKAYSENVFG